MIAFCTQQDLFVWAAQVYHLQLSPSKVLLDGALAPKLAGFGKGSRTQKKREAEKPPFFAWVRPFRPQGAFAGFGLYALVPEPAFGNRGSLCQVGCCFCFCIISLCLLSVPLCGAF